MKNYPSSNSEQTNQTTVWLAIAVLALAFILHPQITAGQTVTRDAPQQQNAVSAAEYWTPERMANAIPKDLRVATTGVALQKGTISLPSNAVPGLAPGWEPGSGPQPEATEIFMMEGTQPQSSAPFTPPSSPTDFNNYSPFQRYRFAFKYLQYPMSTIGKLFFTQDGNGFVCSASVIGRSTLATAGHCIHNGNNNSSGFSSNFLFCPSYNASGVNPAVGCWGWSSATVPNDWFASGSSDRDFGCIVTSTTGTLISNKIGNVTGWTGRSWNYPSKQLIHAFGYPAETPFPGNQIIVVTSPEWYELDRTAGGPVSKYIGSDMTGGSSGGPWWLNFGHPTAEHADSDGSNITDPGQAIGAVTPFINGVNSHRRCTTAGCPAGTVYTQEMGSPQFMKTDGDAQESEDIFAICMGHANNAILKTPMSDRLASAKAQKRTISRATSVIAQRSKGL